MNHRRTAIPPSPACRHSSSTMPPLDLRRPVASPPAPGCRCCVRKPPPPDHRSSSTGPPRDLCLSSSTVPACRQRISISPFMSRHRISAPAPASSSKQGLIQARVASPRGRRPASAPAPRPRPLG
ncbi:hypothetical protein BS78_06G158800 [Paspalum vaginatum]|nr:hypothetical protein BS78_06G158800 [Paspalum vaginatum]